MAKLEGVTIVMRGDVGGLTASSSEETAGFHQGQHPVGTSSRGYSVDNVSQFMEGLSGEDGRGRSKEESGPR